MIRVFGWIVLLAIASTGIFWLSSHPGTIRLEWMGYQIEAAIGLVIALAIFLIIALLFVLMGVRSLLRTPARMLKIREKSGMEKGVDALTDTLLALASNQHEAAERALKRSQKYLPEKPVNDLLQALVSYRSNDIPTTQEALQRMLKHDRTRPIAAKSLIGLSRREGKLENAISYAREALAHAPGDVDIIQSLYDLYVRDARWQEAGGLVRKSRRFRRIDGSQSDRLLAILSLLQAQELKDEMAETRLQEAKTAFQHDPRFTPAATYYVQLLADAGKKKMIPKVLQRAWDANPHPELAEMMIRSDEGKDPAKLAKKLEKMVSGLPTHLESQLVLARAAFLTHAPEKARNHLQAAALVAQQPRIFQQLAELERQAHHEEAAIVWLEKAAHGSRDPVWHCNQCQHTHLAWQLHCAQCDAFNSILWAEIRSVFVPGPGSLLPNER